MPGPRRQDWPQDRPDDLYERLGVTRGADAREIRRSYLELAARYHPDRHQGNPLGDLAKEKLAELNAAYDVLSDPARRAAYDAHVRSGGGGAGGWHPAASAGATGNSAPASAQASRRRSPVRAVITLVVIALSAFLGLRLAPRIGGFFTAIFGSGPGQVLAPVVLGAVVALLIWARVRRSKRR